MPIYKSDGKKDGLQKYNVRINYTSNDGKAKQLTRTAYGLENAKDLERNLIAQLKEKGESTVNRMTFQQLYDEYAVDKKNELREQTLDHTRRDYALYVQPMFAKTRIDKITVPMLKEWKRNIEQRNLSLNTRKGAYKVLNKLLNYAVNSEHLPFNPLKKVGNFKETLSIEKEMQIYTAQEFLKFIGTAKRLAEERQEKQHSLSEWDFYVFFAITYYSGCRKGEIHALKWSDIQGNYLSVKRSIAQKLKGEDRETAPKNKSSIRTLQMPLPLIKILKEHKKRQMKLENFTDDYRICGGTRCLRDTTLDKRNRHYAALSGLSAIRIHDFRHSHVSLLANEGINIQEVARRLGHARVEETWNTYSHLYPREEEKAVAILNKIA